MPALKSSVFTAFTFILKFLQKMFIKILSLGLILFLLLPIANCAANRFRRENSNAAEEEKKTDVDQLLPGATNSKILIHILQPTLFC